MRGFLFVLLSLVLAGCSASPVPPQWTEERGRDHPELGRIVDLRSGEQLSARALLQRLAGSDRLLIGERHDNADHHRLQAWLLAALAGRRGKATVLLEMLNPDQQPKVDEVQRAFAERRAPANLRQALAWQDGWDWALYGPLVQGVLAQQAPLRAANLDRQEMMAIYRAPTELSGERSAAPEVRQALAAFIRHSHCDLLPETQLPAMLAIQQQRDRRMAEQLLAAPAPAVLIAGAFHARKDLGVPAHIADLSPEAEVRVLMLAEVGETVSADEADYVWYTPQAPQVDHCQALRQHRGEK